MATQREIEAQIFQLEKVLINEPELVANKVKGRVTYNSKHFSVKGRIKQLRAQLSQMKNPTGKNAWNEYLAR